MRKTIALVSSGHVDFANFDQIARLIPPTALRPLPVSKNLVDTIDLPKVWPRFRYPIQVKGSSNHYPGIRILRRRQAPTIRGLLLERHSICHGAVFKQRLYRTRAHPSHQGIGLLGRKVLPHTSHPHFGLQFESQWTHERTTSMFDKALFKSVDGDQSEMAPRRILCLLGQVELRSDVEWALPVLVATGHTRSFP